ncbi:MAG: CHASE4 domain-containing protein [Gammaproteobacteria bacterium]
MLGYQLFYAQYLGPKINSFEQETVSEKINLIQRNINKEQSRIELLLRDWSISDDLYHYVQNPSPAFIESNFQDNLFKASHLNLIYIINHRADIIWAKATDQENNEIPLPGLITALENSESGPKLRESDAQIMRGFINTDRGPMMIASAPIINSKADAPSKGTLLLGRFVSEQFLNELKEITGLELSVWPLVDQEKIRNKAADLLSQFLTQKNTNSILDLQKDFIFANFSLKDLNFKPLIVVSLKEPRKLINLFHIYRYFFIYMIFGLGLSFLIFLFFNLKMKFAKPLQQIENYLSGVANGIKVTQRSIHPKFYLDEFYQHLIKQLMIYQDRISKEITSKQQAQYKITANLILKDLEEINKQISSHSQELEDKVRKLPLGEYEQIIVEFSQDQVSEERKQILIYQLKNIHQQLRNEQKIIQIKLNDFHSKIIRIFNVIRKHAYGG